MKTLITAENVSKSFGSTQALKNVSFEITQGQITALVGPNGAGKTTLFSILCGYLHPDTGSIRILDQPLGSSQLFGQLSALPQDAILDPRFSLRKQLSFYGKLQGLSTKEADLETSRVLEHVGLADNHNACIEELSHGMRKRVYIAQALIGGPSIVLLDEATAGLDPINAREIRKLISDLCSETSFILSSHDLAELERLCNHVLFLDKGILSTHDRDAALSERKYMTLQLYKDTANPLETLQQLSGVIQVKQPQAKEFIIEYQPDFEQFDIHLLKYCYQKNLHYRQLINGHTLENQLFEQESS